MYIQSITNRLQTYGDEIQALNERLRLMHITIFGGANTSDRPLDAPEIKEDAPPSQTTEVFNLVEAFAHQDNRITYYLDYAREMLDSLERFTTSNPQPANPTKTAGQLANQYFQQEGGAGTPDKSFHRGR